MEPYYAVIFTSELTDDTDGYAQMGEAMEKLAQTQEGFLGMDSARNQIGITVSYWKDLESIQKWKTNAEHRVAQQLGNSKWYKNYHLRICKVEREYKKS